MSKRQQQEEQATADRVAKRLRGLPLPVLLIKTNGYAEEGHLLINNTDDAAALVAIMARGQFCKVNGYGSKVNVTVAVDAQGWTMQFVDERNIKVEEPTGGAS